MSERSSAVQKADDLQSRDKQSSVGKKSANAFRTISEVADILGVQQHVLRFWETKFTQVKPLKRGGGRRYYRPEDIDVLQHIHQLLYTEGYTIKDVKKLLLGHGKSQVANGEFKKEKAIQDNQKSAAPSAQQNEEFADAPEEKKSLSPRQKAILGSMIGELKELRDLVRSASPEEAVENKSGNKPDDDTEDKGE